jgi:hypothetical protein
LSVISCPTSNIPVKEKRQIVYIKTAFSLVKYQKYLALFDLIPATLNLTLNIQNSTFQKEGGQIV